MQIVSKNVIKKRKENHIGSNYWLGFMFTTKQHNNRNAKDDLEQSENKCSMVVVVAAVVSFYK